MTLCAAVEDIRTLHEQRDPELLELLDTIAQLEMKFDASSAVAHQAT